MPIYTPCGGCGGRGIALEDKTDAEGNTVTVPAPCGVCGGSGRLKVTD